MSESWGMEVKLGERKRVQKKINRPKRPIVRLKKGEGDHVTGSFICSRKQSEKGLGAGNPLEKKF